MARKSEPISLRFPIDELNHYNEIAKKREISLSDLIREALRDKYFPNGHEDIEWLGHA